ncbi:MAG: flagellar hook-basal body complex protein FliE [Planctomycetes bacterium]|nr:flagellar hook-basal body complex protein FliE [Planctomycetota bacterium]MCB9888057.1 flagellar hook-basal body complex protein FliE [Planctomycetota bacterium]
MSGFDIPVLGGSGGFDTGRLPGAAFRRAAEQVGQEITPETKRTGEDLASEREPFVESLNAALHSVRDLQLDARDKARGLATGEPVQVHDLMISMGKSEVAFNLMLEVRNKLLDAWQTLQRSVS